VAHPLLGREVVQVLLTAYPGLCSELCITSGNKPGQLSLRLARCPKHPYAPEPAGKEEVTIRIRRDAIEELGTLNLEKLARQVRLISWDHNQVVKRRSTSFSWSMRQAWDLVDKIFILGDRTIEYDNL